MSFLTCFEFKNLWCYFKISRYFSSLRFHGSSPKPETVEISICVKRNICLKKDVHFALFILLFSETQSCLKKLKTNQWLEYFKPLIHKIMIKNSLSLRTKTKRWRKNKGSLWLTQLAQGEMIGQKLERSVDGPITDRITLPIKAAT